MARIASCAAGQIPVHPQRRSLDACPDRFRPCQPSSRCHRRRSPRGSARSYETTKPKITRLVTITAGVGFVVGAATGGNLHPSMLLAGLGCLLGTALSASGANALNQWFERDRDARMPRTSTRPMATGRLDPMMGLFAASTLSLAGVLIPAHHHGHRAGDGVAVHDPAVHPRLHADEGHHAPGRRTSVRSPGRCRR